VERGILRGAVVDQLVAHIADAGDLEQHVAGEPLIHGEVIGADLRLFVVFRIEGVDRAVRNKGSRNTGLGLERADRRKKERPVHSVGTEPERGLLLLVGVIVGVVGTVDAEAATNDGCATLIS